uniref:Uncharacterized protein n=1 Tax=Romanomermis culicivorax TaxID=13658 RepID=A0A915HV61_ROMCU
MIGVILKVVQLVFMWQTRYKVEDQEKVVALNLKREESCWQRLKRQYGKSFLLCFSHSDENQWPKRSSERMFHDGTQANENFKLFLGYTGALIVATVLCLFFVFKQPWDPSYGSTLQMGGGLAPLK